MWGVQKAQQAQEGEEREEGELGLARRVEQVAWEARQEQSNQKVHQEQF